MKFSGCTLLQVLLSTRDVRASRKICYNLLADPSPIQDSCLGVREAPFQVGHHTSIRALSAQIIGVLEIDLMICASWGLSVTRILLVSAAVRRTKDGAALAISAYWLALRELSITLLEIWQCAC
jgi:hypothetical protein